MHSNTATTIPTKTIGRLSLYRRAIQDFSSKHRQYVFSHEIARACGITSAQVRRDLMRTGFTGSPNKGYRTVGLLESISSLLDDPTEQRAALVGVGNLGRAVLAYFAGRRPSLSILVAFDHDPVKVNRVIHGCRCYAMGDLATIVKEQRVDVAILAVPAPAAQAVADQLVDAGVRGLLNFAPVSLSVPPEVYVEHLDMAISLERVAYFARHGMSGSGRERARR